MFQNSIVNRILPSIPLKVAQRYRKDQLLRIINESWPGHYLLGIWEEEAAKAVDDFCATWVVERNVHCKGGPLTHIPPQKPHVPLASESRCQASFLLGDDEMAIPEEKMESGEKKDLPDEDR